MKDKKSNQKSNPWLLYFIVSCMFSSLAAFLGNPLYGLAAVLFSLCSLLMALKNNRTK